MKRAAAGPQFRRAGALAAALALASPLQSGCIVTLDTVSRLWPEGPSPATPGTSLPARSGPSVRAVKLDRDHGLVCTVVDTAMVRGTSIQIDSTNPNGVKSLVIMLTILEGTVFALAEWKGDHAFHTPYFIVPAGLDVGWGVFRSITIHPEIVRGATVSVDDGEHAGSTPAGSAPCPPGTELVLSGDGETLVTHAGADGRLDQAEVPALIAFLTAHPRVQLVGAGLDTGVAFDASAAPDIVQRAHRAAAPPLPGGGPAPAATLPRARAIVRLDPSGRPHVYGVPIDFPPAALCGGMVGCPFGQRCGDRGDGVPLCFGPGAIHGFCAAGTDCASGLCARRPDGVGVCQ